jgi:hypothetical protein
MLLLVLIKLGLISKLLFTSGSVRFSGIMISAEMTLKQQLQRRNQIYGLLGIRPGVNE